MGKSPKKTEARKPKPTNQKQETQNLKSRNCKPDGVESQDPDTRLALRFSDDFG
jgi:hypothetical protein